MLRAKFMRFALWLGLALALVAAPAPAASLLDNAKQQFVDGNGVPLALGTVEFYIPNTLTHKNTWSNSTLTVVNANPLTLDAAGRAIIWGVGPYRQIVKDSAGNTIWDQVTNNWPDLVSVTIPATAGGSGNAIALTSASGVQTTGLNALSAYQQIVFLATQNNSGATTASFAGLGGTLGPYSVYIDGSGGATALAGTEIRTGNLYSLNFDQSLAAGSGGWHLGGPGLITALSASLTALTARVTALEASVAALDARITALEALRNVAALAVPVSGFTFKAPGGNMTLNWGGTSAIAYGATETVTLEVAYPNTAYECAWMNVGTTDGSSAAILNKTLTTFDVQNVSATHTDISGNFICSGGQL